MDNKWLRIILNKLKIEHANVLKYPLAVLNVPIVWETNPELFHQSFQPPTISLVSIEKNNQIKIFKLPQTVPFI